MTNVLAGLFGATAMLAAVPAFAADCNAVHDAPWRAGGAGFVIEAFTRGPTCDTAVAVFTVRGPDGALLHFEALDAGYVLGLAGRTDAADMEAGLKDWTNQDGAGLANTADLPAWKAGDDAPAAGEFPFLPAEGFDQPGYEDLRAMKAPMMCYATGSESLSCLALVDGALQAVGFQQVPG